MSRSRTITRGALFLAAMLGASVVAAVASARGKPVPRIVFPVVAQTQYVDDFGAPRAGGPHQGIDIVAAKRSPAVAAEAGRVKYWTSSASAGCMLYLYGASGTMYEYIHLNNDVTMRNDNRGKCVRGTAYTVRNGARVVAGQQIGYVGDSGDANGGHAHLHFEVHPGGGKATDPYPYLQGAQKLLFAAKAGSPFALTLTGKVVSATRTELTVNVATSQAWPSNLTLTKLNRQIVLSVSPTAVVQIVTPEGELETASLAQAARGDGIVVWTEPALASLKAARGDDDALTAALIQLSP